VSLSAADWAGVFSPEILVVGVQDAVLRPMVQPLTEGARSPYLVVLVGALVSLKGWRGSGWVSDSPVAARTSTAGGKVIHAEDHGFIPVEVSFQYSRAGPVALEGGEHWGGDLTGELTSDFVVREAKGLAENDESLPEYPGVLVGSQLGPVHLSADCLPPISSIHGLEDGFLDFWLVSAQVDWDQGSDHCGRLSRQLRPDRCAQEVRWSIGGQLGFDVLDPK